MKYHILHDFGTFIPFKRKFSDDFEDLHILKLLRNFDVNSDLISRKSYE